MWNIINALLLAKAHPLTRMRAMHAHNATYLPSIQWGLGLEILLSRDPQIGLQSGECQVRYF